MKFNILYLLFPAALLACVWIARDFQGQSAYSFFGIAETEPQTLNFDHDVAVRARYVKAGDRVRKGDTLAVFYRADLDRGEAEGRGRIDETETERAAELAVLEKEKELVELRRQAEIRELRADIELLRIEDSLKTAYRKNIYPDLSPAGNQLVTEKTAALQQEIAAADARAREELRLLAAKQNTLRAVAAARVGQAQTALGFVRAERERLALLSPIDGYVEDVLFGENALIPAHRELIKLNPQAPNRIIGFIHEAAEVPFFIGQEVDLASSSRPDVQARGIIVGSNPKMTELPLRLRKFIELRSWGREVFIQLPDSNSFFIGEKIAITLPEN